MEFLIFMIFVCAIVAGLTKPKSRRRRRKVRQKVHIRTIGNAESAGTYTIDDLYKRQEKNTTLPRSEPHSSQEQPEPKAPSPTHKYKKQRKILTNNEARFYTALLEAIDEKAIVSTKVRVADVIQPDCEQYTSEFGTAFNKISRKHFDFVLIDKTTFEILAAIELDDSSHQRADRIKSDEVKNEAMKSAGVALIRYKTKRKYDKNEIIKKLAKQLNH